MTPTRRRIIYAVLLTIAFAALVMAFLIHPEPTAPARDQVVVAVSPTENASEQRQTTVFAEVTTDYDGALTIDGHPIPDDQVDRLLTGNLRLAFTPGPGKEITKFRTGLVCARVDYWPLGQDRATTSRQYAWCFKLT
ncbi:MAG: hypothetical protein QOK43_2403 [Acidimicrobiaceae bacterium]|nr:hypothetical protein [Acidimicrobiaceae bacterium]